MNQYETLDYGILFQNSLSKTISDKFGATSHRKSKGNILVFNLEKFEKFEEIYGNDNNSNEVHIDVKLVVEEDEKTVDDLSESYNNRLQAVCKDEEDSNNEKRIDDHESGEYSKTDISIDNVGYVGNVGFSARASINREENEKDILTNNDSMKDNSQNNNLPIFNYNYNYNDNNEINPIMEDNNKKDDTHLLNPTQPTLLTSSIEESSVLRCPYCDYKDIEVNLGLHIFEKHRYYLRQIERDSLDFNIRTDYVVEQIKLQQEKNKN